MKITLYIVLITVLLTHVVYARKARRNKHPQSEDDSTPQPNVVTYSTFGFNDVGAYDGFVPSSPDYVNYLSKHNQESGPRLYAPAFPTAMDNYPSPSQNSPTYSLDEDTGPQASMLQYPQSSMSFMNIASLDSDAQSPNVGQHEVYSRNAGESAPIYGTKIGSRNKSRYNNTDFDLFSSPTAHSDTKFSSFHEVQSSYHNKPSIETKNPFAEENKKYQFNFNYATTHPSTETDDFMKPAQSNSQSSINFPKVIDFTKYKQYYPTDIDIKFTTTTTTNSPNTFKPPSDLQNEDSFIKNFEEFSTKFPYIGSGFKGSLKDNKDTNDEKANTRDKETVKSSMASYQDPRYSQNYLNYHHKEVEKENKYNVDHKDKFKNSNWGSTNYTNDFKTWKNPIKGYQYSTNYSNMNFEFDFSGGKTKHGNNNHNKDEVVPAGSDLVGNLASYQFPGSEFSDFKHGVKGFDNEDVGNVFESFKPQGYKYDPEEYVKSIYSSSQTPTSPWGSSFKNSPFSSFKYPKRPQYGYGDEGVDDIVHIPKRPYGNKYSYGKIPESKPVEWSSYTSHKPYKPKRPQTDWHKELGTRFKTEEDLLGLRTHDTSLASYLPTYKPSASTGDYEYKNLVEKWRQSYLKSKYKDLVGISDFEGYASEPKHLHVPVPKPYAIEVPHPVIVPVPQPYPVRVPIPKPVAIPVVHEVKVEVEKPVPYAVFKKVPYPIEKPVPVPVEKEVPVPVVKPYPVAIPHIRPVFHHTRPKDDIEGIDDEDDYYRRPETKKNPYAVRVKSTRGRSRRPTRTHAERNRRRWPTRRPDPTRTRRPEYPAPYKQYEAEFEDFDATHREYIRHCKRTGNC